MKMKRSEFKAIIKECLIEILSEGIGQSLLEVKQNKAQLQRTTQQVQKQNFRKQPSLMESIAFGHTKPKDPVLDRKVVNQQVIETINGLTKDPVLASIFADTANTTLVEQSAAGHGRESPGMQGVADVYGDMATKIVAQTTPDQIFGEETTSRWAEAAFSGKGPIAHNHQDIDVDFNPYAPNPDIKPA